MSDAFTYKFFIFSSYFSIKSSGKNIEKLMY